eukprot:TRINITY_DN2166_c0_g1_i2.p1 TRINITY_DN2166_c0_g1~~TRINITY_DN2166_c0_g1_i2.p1  ORF type:complete len:443 (+),score=69.64 TRINITY_DN2166_c0_g1_i2:619-1947(+)
MFGEDKGVHMFIVALRNQNGKLYKGVTVSDCGAKFGLNAIDNGRMWFDNVKIPREMLLNKYADVTKDGEYVTQFDSAQRVFTTSIGSLVGGRVTISKISLQCMKVGLETAIRYSYQRRQFSSPSSQMENKLIDYPIHQRRLFPYLASTYVFNEISYSIIAEYREFLELDPSDPKSEIMSKNIHFLSSLAKPLCSWEMAKSLRSCRECCGGQGIGSVNRIAVLIQDTESFLTFEGDNYILLQQATRQILKDYHIFKTQSMCSDRISFLNNSKKMPSPVDLLDKNFHIWAFEQRERLLLNKSVELITISLTESTDAFEAWNKCVPLTTELAISHFEREALVHYYQAIDRVEIPEIREGLTMLGQLFALWRLHESPSFLRYFNYKDWNIGTYQLNQTIERLCNSIKLVSIDLLEGFGIPPHLLGPIAFYQNGEAYFAKDNMENHQ